MLNHPELCRSISVEKFLLVTDYEAFVDQKKYIDGLFQSKKDIRALVTKKNLDTDNLQEFSLESFRTRTGTVSLND